MKVPQGVTSHELGQVCRLRKSLYGLKQASKQWFGKLTCFLLQHGFTQGQTGHTLFINRTADTLLALLVYVDDILLVEPSLA